MKHRITTQIEWNRICWAEKKVNKIEQFHASKSNQSVTLF